MTTIAAVTTAKGTGPITTIELFGITAKQIISDIFKSKTKSELEPGKIILGSIETTDRTIDQVIVACESMNSFVINCHGNPIIVSDIMKLLESKGAQPVVDEKLLTAKLSARTTLNSIEIEASLAIPKIKTLPATKLLLAQPDLLAQKVKSWLNEDIEDIKKQAKDLLYLSKKVKPLLFGAKIILAGPPNSGKSTLLNVIAGKQKAITTNIKGTTRDYVTADCVIGNIFAELIDTAGLDSSLNNNHLDQAAQNKSTQLIEDSDLILLILDANQAETSLTDDLHKIIDCQNTIIVLNKSDLPQKLNLPATDSPKINISAKTGDSINNLTKLIQTKLNSQLLETASAVCFTARQMDVIQKISTADSKQLAEDLISELINAPPCV